jgi:CheY-like chemotaxis protein
MTKILIADDEANILMLINIVLKDLGAEIITAENGEIAAKKAVTHKPDLIITDVVMPKMNGFEVCKTVRNTPEIASTPIIILSALGDEYNKITGFEEGADDYIVKPFNVDDLKLRAKALIARHKSKTEAGRNSHDTTNHPNKKSTSYNEDAFLADSQLNMGVYKTGNSDLDERLYGGLPKGSNILVVGKTGAGKSSFAREFIREGLKNKDKCLWVAVDDDPQRIRNSITRSDDTEVSTYESRGQLRFVDAYSWSSLIQPENEPFAVTGSLELNNLSGIVSDASYELGQTVQKKAGGRRIIDSISSLLINFDLAHSQRFLNQIARTAVSFGGVTTLFIIEEGTVDDTVLNNVKYIMDGIIEFQEDGANKSLRVASMKWARFDNSWVTLPSKS